MVAELPKMWALPGYNPRFMPLNFRAEDGRPVRYRAERARPGRIAGFRIRAAAPVDGSNLYGIHVAAKAEGDWHPQWNDPDLPASEQWKRRFTPERVNAWALRDLASRKGSGYWERHLEDDYTKVFVAELLEVVRQHRDVESALERVWHDPAALESDRDLRELVADGVLAYEAGLPTGRRFAPVDLAGFASVTFDKDNPDIGLVSSWYVRPTCQQLGIGLPLLRAAVAHNSAHGRVSCATVAEWLPARGVYETAAGAVVVADHQLLDDPMAAYDMQLWQTVLAIPDRAAYDQGPEEIARQVGAVRDHYRDRVAGAAMGVAARASGMAGPGRGPRARARVAARAEQLPLEAHRQRPRGRGPAGSALAAEQ